MELKSLLSWNQKIGNNCCHYDLVEGIRFVKPYLRTHVTSAKERWFGSDLLTCYTREYSIPENICLDMIQRGRLLVNNERTRPNYILKPLDRILLKNDVIIEKPILDFQSITILPNFYDNNRNTSGNGTIDHKTTCYPNSNEYYAIEKPASVPVHSTGKYFKNSLHFILENEYQMNNVRFVHRLDKCTTGVLVCTKSAHANRIYHELSARSTTSSTTTTTKTTTTTAVSEHQQDGNNESQEIQKYYVARVHGLFVDTSSVHHIKYPLQMINTRRGLWDPIVPDKVFPEIVPHEFHKPIVKDAYTQILPLKYSKELNMTLILCRPITGRTHQIRCHLRGMGYPIVGDLRIPDINDKSNWSRKYEIMKQFENDQDKCLRIFRELAIKEFFENRDMLSHEFQIDLHSIVYHSPPLFSFESQEYPDWVFENMFTSQEEFQQKVYDGIQQLEMEANK
jgi:23S rRNA-/tRNA-specific pseudouridylate synthase